MTSRKDIFSKYYASDIFNTNPNYCFSPTKPRLRLNRSTLENTKEDVFNIGKERRIERGNDRKKEKEKEPILSHSAEKRKKNLARIYGSDIFNTRKATSLEKRKGKQQFEKKTNKSTCFEEMKNNDEYVRDLKYYDKQHRGEKKTYNPGLYIETVSPQERYYNSYYGHNCEGVLPGTYLKSEGNMDEYKLNYIKKKMHLNRDERLFNDVGVDQKRKVGERAPRENRYPKKNFVYLYKNDKRRFVGLDEYPKNNCKINKQIQFESHIFSNDENSYIKTNQEIEGINDRIVREKNKHYHLNVLGQPIIRVNRNINLKNQAENKDYKIRPVDLNWNSPKAQIMFGAEHENNLYKTFGKNGPTSYQIKLYQFSDSGNRDTLSGEPKTPYLNMKRPKKDEIVNDEVSRNIEKMVNNIPNLNNRQKLEVKQKTSVLDCKSDDEWNNKAKTLKDFYKKGSQKRKIKEITEKPNNIDKKINENKDAGYHDYVITYSLKGNQFDKFEDHEIKNMFGKKGINVYDIHKNPFVKGNSNTINLKISGNDSNNQLNEKIKSIQDDLKKKNYRISIEKDDKNKKKGHRKINQSGSMGEFPKTTVNAGGTRFKIMPPEYKVRRGFIKEFAGINYGYKKLPQ